MIRVLKQNIELFDLFTKQEEYNSLILDKYGRFPFCLSKHRNILEPEASKFLLDNGLQFEYPEKKKFTICLTHDIDAIKFPILSVVSGVAKSLIHRQVKNAVMMPFYNIIEKWNPWCNFKDIIALEEKYGAKSSFYFLSLEKEDTEFNFKVENYEHQINTIADSGWEVGLHGGPEAYNNMNRVKEEKKRLEKVLGKEVIGIRNHYLKFKVPDTWELLSKAGFKYDSTFGYADMVGFRNGMCHPFKPFNLNTNSEIDIFEIPLTISDFTLLEYMKMDIKNAWYFTKQLIDKVESYNGVITILWHNAIYMQGETLKLYEKILKYCYDKNAWMTSGEEICSWWNENV
jgi:peptidoglycan/xylan/chitin deacetylase (PgdA/CDA1 family)